MKSKKLNKYFIYTVYRSKTRKISRAASIFPDESHGSSSTSIFPKSRLLSHDFYDESEILTLNFATGEFMDNERYYHFFIIFFLFYLTSSAVMRCLLFFYSC